MATEDATIMIKLQSSDKKVFEVPLKVAQKSNLIKTMLEDLGMEGEDELVPLPNVPGETLENVLKWATQHQNDAPIKADHRYKLTDWDNQFLFDKSHEELFSLIRAANYLDMKDLICMTCQTVSKCFAGKSTDYILDMFDANLHPKPPPKPLTEEQKFLKSLGLPYLNWTD